MKFSNDRRDFFWMQDFSASNDDINCKKVNDIINGVESNDSNTGLFLLQIPANA